MTLDRRNQILTVVLGIIIIGLGYWLVRSIIDPYQVVIDRQKMTTRVHDQMLDLRSGIIRYNRRNNHYPPTAGGLDSLINFIKTDSAVIAEHDSLFKDDPAAGYTFKLDSLIYSPRPPHKRFEYTLNDTIRPPIYLLKDPDGDDKIGSLTKTTLINAPSWQ